MNVHHRPKRSEVECSRPPCKAGAELAVHKAGRVS